MFEEAGGVGPGLFETGGGVTWPAGKADRAAVADGPVGIHQLVQDLGSATGGFFQRGAYRFEDQFQAGEFSCGGQDLGGVRSLPSAFPDHTGLPHPVQGQGKKPVRAVVLGQPVTKVSQHTVMEAGIVQFHG